MMPFLDLPFHDESHADVGAETLLPDHEGVLERVSLRHGVQAILTVEVRDDDVLAQRDLPAGKAPTCAHGNLLDAVRPEAALGREGQFLVLGVIQEDRHSVHPELGHCLFYEHIQREAQVEARRDRALDGSERPLSLELFADLLLHFPALRDLALHHPVHLSEGSSSFLNVFLQLVLVALPVRDLPHEIMGTGDLPVTDDCGGVHLDADNPAALREHFAFKLLVSAVLPELLNYSFQSGDLVLRDHVEDGPPQEFVLRVAAHLHGLTVDVDIPQVLIYHENGINCMLEEVAIFPL